ncbi:hypothetical protein PanWU01x14_162170, partial [Parasponia andersonii]
NGVKCTATGINHLPRKPRKKLSRINKDKNPHSCIAKYHTHIKVTSSASSPSLSLIHTSYSKYIIVYLK